MRSLPRSWSLPLASITFVALLVALKVIVRRLNELAVHFRENKPSIDNLRLQLAIVRRPVPL
jgi:hypothetical protein